MRYKRLLVISTCLIFITALVVCFFNVFKIAEINLSTTTLTNSKENVDVLVEENIKNNYGKNLIFVSEREIKSNLQKASPYVNVKKVEKQFPNKLNIEVVERKEVFCLQIQNDFYMLDENFIVLAKKDTNKNNIDDFSNILINVNIADYNSDTLKVGSELKFFDKGTSKYLKELSNLIYANRNNIVKVDLTVKKNGFFVRELTLNFKEGLTIVLQSAEIRSVDKFNEALKFYQNADNKGDTTKYYVVVDALTDKVVCRV